MSATPIVLPSAMRPLRPTEGGAVDPQQLKSVAEEFEAMMLAQMLKQMRQSMVSDEEGDEGLGFGTETMTETVDVELARQLSRAGGIGLTSVIQRSMTQALAPGTAQPVSPVPAGQDALPVLDVSATRVGRSADASTSVYIPRAATGASLAPLAMPDGHVSSEYGWRTDPFLGTRKFHGGIDLKAAYGQDVPAAGAGTVTHVGERGAYGLMVEVAHANGTTSRYAHLSSAEVAVGDTVTEGQHVGRVGQSGRATGPHLHFEVLVKGQRVDPALAAASTSTDGLVKKSG